MHRPCVGRTGVTATLELLDDAGSVERCGSLGEVNPSLAREDAHVALQREMPPQPGDVAASLDGARGRVTEDEKDQLV